MKLMSVLAVAVLIPLTVNGADEATVAQDWLRFRGDNGAGISPCGQTPPIQWSETRNLRWKVDLPGPGSSSPIVVGDRVFVTCWSGYAVDRGNPGQQEDLRRHLLCFDRDTGKTLWNKSVAAVLPEDQYGGMFAQHGYASHTPVSDGERVYVFFGKTGALAFDLDGNQLWQTSLGTGSDPRGWGSASSPILYNDLLIVTASAESESLAALNKLTGEIVWKKQASGFSGTWSTPILVPVDESRTDLVLAVAYEFWGFNPETGKLRWYCESLDSDSMCGSPILNNGVIYAIDGRSGGSVAVKSGGDGDCTATHRLWAGTDRGRISTPVCHEGRLHWIANGIANCLDAETGEEIYQARLERSSQAAAPAVSESQGSGRGGFGQGRGGFGGMGGSDYSSPVVAGDKMYFVSRSGDMYVIQLGSDFKQLALNHFGGEPADFSATPAISGDHLFIRSSKSLYCVAPSE